MELKLPPPLVLLLSALLMWSLDRLVPIARISVPGTFRIVGAFVAAGIALGLLGVVAFRRARTTINPHRPDKSSALVTDGIYRHSRNPMYLGLVLLLLAWGAYLSNLVALLVIPAFILYLNRYQIEPEERALQARFGEDYAAYKRAVRRWL